MALMLAVCYLLPMLVSVASTAVIQRWSIRRGFVDHPSERKAHVTPVPLGGGLAIFGTFLVCAGGALIAASVLRASGPPAWVPGLVRMNLDGVVNKSGTLAAILAGAGVLHILGLLDDRRPIGAAPKLIVQLLVALVISGWFQVRALEMFGPVIAVTASAAWIVVITNAFNFLDNMDGLSGGVAVIALLIFAFSARLTGQLFVPALSLVFAGAVAGFLLFNFPPARIFMGDAGSMVIGYMLGVLPILTTFHDPRVRETPFGVLVPVLVLAVPLYDFASVVWIRRRVGSSIFRADRRHFSHRLSARGLGPRTTVLTIYLATASTALPAVFLPNCTWPGAALIVAQCLCVVSLIALLEQGNDGARPKDTRR